MSRECISPCTYVVMEAGRREREIARREIVKWTCLKVHLLRGGQNCRCFHRALTNKIHVDMLISNLSTNKHEFFLKINSKSMKFY
jgi:hypothetical protein